MHSTVPPFIVTASGCAPPMPPSPAVTVSVPASPAPPVPPLSARAAASFSATAENVS